MCHVMASEARIVDRHNDNNHGPKEQHAALDVPSTTVQAVVMVVASCCMSVSAGCIGVIHALMRRRECSGSQWRLFRGRGWRGEDGGGRDGAGPDEHLLVRGWVCVVGWLLCEGAWEGRGGEAGGEEA